MARAFAVQVSRALKPLQVSRAFPSQEAQSVVSFPIRGIWFTFHPCRITNHAPLSAMVLRNIDDGQCSLRW